MDFSVNFFDDFIALNLELQPCHMCNNLITINMLIFFLPRTCSDIDLQKKAFDGVSP